MSGKKEGFKDPFSGAVKLSVEKIMSEGCQLSVDSMNKRILITIGIRVKFWFTNIFNHVWQSNITRILSGNRFKCMGSNSNHSHSRLFSSDFHKGINLFFIKPKLSIEYDEKNEPATFCPELQLIGRFEGIHGSSTIITQKYLRVRIKNVGRGVAHNCRAKIRLTKWDKSIRTPPERDDSRFLAWIDSSERKNIGAKGGSELLQVVFSDSRFKEVSTDDKSCAYALLSTIDSLKGSQTLFIPLQHAFGMGDFEAEISILSEEGSATKSQFRIHVDEQFNKLSMEKIS